MSSRVELPVSPTERNLQYEQDAELGKKIRERIGSLETSEIKADMIIMCAHILIRTMAETNAETAKWTIEDFSIAGKHYGNYLINIKRTKKK